MAIFAITLTAPAQEATIPEGVGKEWGYAEILELIDEKQKSGTPLRSVGELIAALPPALKTHFTFVYDTKNRLQEASPLHPRAIVFTRKLIYTFNGHPSQKGFDSLELMEFDRERRRFELREIRFEGKGAEAKAVPSRATPNKCLECHGSDPKPIWNAYDKWPGVYGSDDDHLRGDELRNFRAFLVEVRRAPGNRYALLRYPAGTDVPPYGRRGGQGDELYRVNLLLTQMLTRMNALRVTRLIEESPYYMSMRWAVPDLVYSYQSGRHVGTFGCGLPGESLVETLRTMASRMTPHRPPPATFPDLVFAALGLPVDRVSMQRGSTEYQYSDGTELFFNVVRTALLRRLAEEDSGLSRRLKFGRLVEESNEQAYELYRYIAELVGTSRDVDISDNHCAYITGLAEDQFEALAKNGVPAVPPGSTARHFSAWLREAENHRVSPSIPSSCVACHSVSDRGPKIPFGDAVALGKALSAEDGRLHRAILSRIQPEARASERMPPPNEQDFFALSAAERADFTRLLDSLRVPAKN